MMTRSEMEQLARELTIAGVLSLRERVADPNTNERERAIAREMLKDVIVYVNPKPKV